MQITGIILAGGKSSRMGYNKAFLDLGGLWLIKKVADILSPVSGEIIIAGGNQKELGVLGYPVVQDIYPNCGPISGIHAGLSAASNYYSFILACDTPFIDSVIIRRIINEAEGFDAAIMKHRDFYEPLFSVYSKKFIPAAEKSIKEGKYKVMNALSLVKWKSVVFSPSQIPSFDKQILNINTPEDYQKAKKLDKN